MINAVCKNHFGFLFGCVNAITVPVLFAYGCGVDNSSARTKYMLFVSVSHGAVVQYKTARVCSTASVVWYSAAQQCCTLQ